MIYACFEAHFYFGSTRWEWRSDKWLFRFNKFSVCNLVRSINAVPIGVRSGYWLLEMKSKDKLVRNMIFISITGRCIIILPLYSLSDFFKWAQLSRVERRFKSLLPLNSNRINWWKQFFIAHNICMHQWQSNVYINSACIYWFSTEKQKYLLWAAFHNFVKFDLHGEWIKAQSFDHMCWFIRQ